MIVIDYWDSYWIIQGLIESELFSTVNDTLQNFMDEIENFGFIPNGGRIYCKLHDDHIGMLLTFLQTSIAPSLRCSFM